MKRIVAFALVGAALVALPAAHVSAHEPTDIAELSRRVARAPGNVDLVLQRAEAYLRADMLDRARADLVLAESLQPGDPRTSYLTALVLVAREELGEAERELDQLIARHGGSLRRHALRGHVRETIGQLDDAADDYAAALGYGDDVELYRSHARVLSRLGRLADAADALRAGVQAMVGSAVLRRDLVGVLRSLRLWDEALVHIDAVRTQARVDVEWDLLYGAVLAEAGRAREARAAREGALAGAEVRLARRPTALAHAARGEALHALGRMDEAALEARAALELAPRNARALSLLRAVSAVGGAR